MTRKNNYMAVPAKVKLGDKLVDLDVSNAGAFISRKSLVGGSATFDSIVASKFGFSMDNCFYELYVHRHKTKATYASTTAEDIIRMRGGEDTASDNDDVEVSEEKDGEKDADAAEGDDTDDEVADEE
jgi:hypothetical protein